MALLKSKSEKHLLSKVYLIEKEISKRAQVPFKKKKDFMDAKMVFVLLQRLKPSITYKSFKNTIINSPHIYGVIEPDGRILLHPTTVINYFKKTLPKISFETVEIVPESS